MAFCTSEPALRALKEYLTFSTIDANEKAVSSLSKHFVELFQGLVRRLRDKEVAEDGCDEAPCREENIRTVVDRLEHWRHGNPDYN